MPAVRAHEAEPFPQPCAGFDRWGYVLSNSPRGEVTNATATVQTNWTDIEVAVYRTNGFLFCISIFE